MRSSEDWLVSSETTVSVTTLMLRLQNAAWLRGSSHSSPNSASGRNHMMPQGPLCNSIATWGDTDSNEGRKLHHTQTTNPAAMAAVAACREASRQNRAARTAGKNWAMAVNEISPIGARASESRVKKK